MRFIAIKYWYDDLESVDRWKLVGILAVALVLLTPWRKDLLLDATVGPKEGELVPFLSPGQGYVRELYTEKGKVLDAGDMVFSYYPQDRAPSSAQVPFNPVQPRVFRGGYSYGNSEEEIKVMDRYRRQMTEANTYISSYQDQLNRAYREQGYGSEGARLAQNALERARAVPGELSRKQQQELTDIRNRRESDNRATAFAQSALAQPANRTVETHSGFGDVAVLADQKAYVWSIAIRGRSLLSVGMECLSLLPEGAAMEVTAAVPATLTRELHPGGLATLEVVRWMNDAENLPMRLEKVGNRNLDREEVLALNPKAPAEIQYVLATFTAVDADARLVPPPKNCKIHLAGAARCLLQRMFF